MNTMAKDLSQTKWHGVPRQAIPWFPQVDPEACIGCELCFVTCGREVYEIEMPDGKHRQAVAERPYNCMVGCSTCAMVCPTQAIAFPGREVVWGVEKEFKIFNTVRKEAAAKREKAAEPPPIQPEKEVEPTAVTRIPVEIAGLFGEKRLLIRLEELIADRPYDIENLHLTVPTVKGLLEGAPAYMQFDATSTDQTDVLPLITEIKALVVDSGLVWVDEETQKES